MEKEERFLFLLGLPSRVGKVRIVKEEAVGGTVEGEII